MTRLPISVRRLPPAELLPLALFIISQAALAQFELQPRELAVLTPPEVADVYPAGGRSGGLTIPLPPEGIAGLLVHVEDSGPDGGGEACPKDQPITNTEALAGNIAFVRRGECALCLKVENIGQNTDAVAVVIYNDERVPDDDTSVMDYPGEGCLPEPIPSLFVSRATGLLLLDALTTGDVTVRLQPTGTTDTEDAAETAAFALAVYPNPVRGTARLTLTLAEGSAVRVEAFDVLGRRVARLHDGPLAAGPHALEFTTAGLPAGVYVVRATTETASATRRLVVR